MIKVSSDLIKPMIFNKHALSKFKDKYRMIFIDSNHPHNGAWNEWYSYRFENEEDELLFKLKFSDYILNE